ncbi:TIR domain-containing protein [Marinobacter nauticus]|uniref:Nucleotide-binding protein with TIR-like domain n=1 Tax=Marinobacter nauticus TaxID=2743 RepID=A0A368URR0_MARNT|nr:nucleotide-binding protein [Marinobacter nauticus]RBP69759.1 putative nucleotide-binding protein with TIR-like domain [Marinobacter nauticus]RCW31472.1 putative nucleotide-binding protein with TIR-like domain [Marinobacter nauticus]
MSNKPTVFIASSSEAISVAEAVHIKLEQELRVRLWENAFDLSSVTITTLIDKTKEADYSVFVFHPDDKSIIRDKEYSAVRDNVILELGMFIGALGLEKCFILVPKSAETAFRLPTDLAGVTASFYDDQEENLSDAVTGSCAKIKQVIKKLESQKSKTESTSEIDLLKRQLNHTQSQIWSLGHDVQRAQEQAQQLQESIKHHFFTVAKPATPAEIKAWEDGAKESYLKEVKIRDHNVYFVDRDVIIPPLHGANSISVIVAKEAKIYGIDKWSHNSIYYMDGYRTDARV